MPVCKFCGKKYAHAVAKKTFCKEYPNLSYAHFKENLCGACAIEAIDDYEEEVYFEKCDECGSEFDFVADNYEFKSYFDPREGTKLTDYWKNNKILCASCALAEI